MKRRKKCSTVTIETLRELAHRVTMDNIRLRDNNMGLSWRLNKAEHELAVLRGKKKWWQFWK
jgi:hypothetical protein